MASKRRAPLSISIIMEYADRLSIVCLTLTRWDGMYFEELLRYRNQKSMREIWRIAEWAPRIQLDPNKTYCSTNASALHLYEIIYLSDKIQI